MGIIYKIIVGDKIYIGSTIQLICKRQARHNYNLRNDNYNQNLYKCARENNIDKLECIIIEEIENELLKDKETFYINNTINLLNHRIANNSKRKENDKKYRQSEKGKIKASELCKTYYNKNRDKILKRHKEYYIKNKDKWIK